METKHEQIKSGNISEKISISLIKQVIKKYTNEANTETNINDLESLEKFDYFFQNDRIFKYFLLKRIKFFKFINNIKITSKAEYVYNKEIIFKNKIFLTTSILFLKTTINNCNHYKIRKYLKSLLIFYIDGKISINNLILILEIILISIIELLKKDSKKQYQMLDIKLC